MATLFEYPGGSPRYYTRKHGNIHHVFAHGTGRGAFYIKGDTVFSTTGKPIFSITDNWLLPYDGSAATLYFGEPIDGEPNPGSEGIDASPKEPSK